ncbi:ATPase [Salinisphaera sp. PC39]|uniref:acyclic terpene utilization AtuA family protein n=1 Tax=Salinisphaera sp. PC39 TaxID=1304156 RepID=UPI0033406635
MTKTVRIGGGASMWGDTQTAPGQLVRKGELDYLLLEYLAEVTMSILTAQRMRDASMGWARDFVPVVTPLLPEIAKQGIKIVTNAGGVNPDGCRDALQKACEEAGVELKIAVVTGDNLMPRRDELGEDVLKPLDPEQPRPDNFLSMNAYLGALPIKQAFDDGADVVITGRCVDSALALGPLMHEFGWSASDLDLLSAGSLAGHLLECGAQSTGGNFTDWRDVPEYENMGFPVAECAADGSFLLTKPPETGGLVTVGTVGEQMLYEIGNPAAYVLPDVVCDWREVTLEQVDKDVVRVAGARGTAPTDSYKVSATYPDGFRLTALFMVGGIEAVAKAERVANALLEKNRRLLKDKGFADYRQADVEAIGSEAMYGPHSRSRDTREVMVKIAVTHEDEKALKLFGTEVAQAATGMVPGITGYFAGRPKPSRIVRLYSALVRKTEVPVSVDSGDGPREIEIPAGEGAPPAPVSAAPGEIAEVPADAVEVPLIRLAIARSGDKGDDSNIGVIARKPEYLPYIRAALTEEAVADYFSHLLKGQVYRFELPGINALNFLLTRILGGGGVASLRADPQGKCYGQMLLDFPIAVPREIAEKL